MLWEIHSSAHRHGIADDDILHAIEHSMVVDDIGEDPTGGWSSAPTAPPTSSKSSSSSPPKATG
jgi:hypothetical protein